MENSEIPLQMFEHVKFNMSCSKDEKKNLNINLKNGPISIKVIA
jgi:hypothetical protein